MGCDFICGFGHLVYAVACINYALALSQLRWQTSSHVVTRVFVYLQAASFPDVTLYALLGSAETQCDSSGIGNVGCTAYAQEQLDVTRGHEQSCLLSRFADMQLAPTCLDVGEHSLMLA